MAEVGLLLFAKTALAVMQEVMPPYGSKFSKDTFTRAATDDHPLPDALRGLDVQRG
jgi:hypothetical protein